MSPLVRVSECSARRGSRVWEERHVGLLAIRFVFVVLMKVSQFLRKNLTNVRLVIGHVTLYVNI
jgi:hypothetical protein